VNHKLALCYDSRFTVTQVLDTKRDLQSLNNSRAIFKTTPTFKLVCGSDLATPVFSPPFPSPHIVLTSLVLVLETLFQHHLFKVTTSRSTHLSSSTPPRHCRVLSNLLLSATTQNHATWSAICQTTTFGGKITEEISARLPKPTRFQRSHSNLVSRVSTRTCDWFLKWSSIFVFSY